MTPSPFIAVSLGTLAAPLQLRPTALVQADGTVYLDVESNLPPRKLCRRLKADGIPHAHLKGRCFVPVQHLMVVSPRVAICLLAVEYVCQRLAAQVAQEGKL